MEDATNLTLNDTLGSGLAEAAPISVEELLAVLADNVDHLFLVIMGTLILLMQAGFAFLEAGSVRAKNTTNILIKNFSDLCCGIRNVEL